MTLCFPLPRAATQFPRFMSKQGSFGALRKHDVHTGVDLYTVEGASVLAMEEGEVVAVVDFTGPPESPWWLFTKAVMVEGASGVLCYGEVETRLQTGDRVLRAEPIANVLPVLKEVRIDIPGHSRFMLHLELYDRGVREPVTWRLGEPCPKGLRDPLPLLSRAWNERAVQEQKEV